MSDLLLRLFGPFEGFLGDRPLTHFRTAKVQALLVYLATEPFVLHQREALMALLWPDLPLESAQINLRQILYQLRKSIPEVDSVTGGRVPLLLSERQTVQLNPEAAIRIDVKTFATHLEEVRRHPHADWLSCSHCTQRLEEAVALYRGTFLADFYLEDSNEFEDWAHRRREAYRRQVMDTLAALGEIRLWRGDHVAASAAALRQLELDDLDERAARQLMESLARDGRRGEALTVYDELRQRLRDELGMAPSAKTTHLAEQINTESLETRLKIPAAVRGYKLLGELGVGTFGVVHRAIQPGVGREVAIKIIHPRFANHPDFIRRFEAEAQTVARLEHPHVVPLYDYWREPDNAYLVMRWLRGGNLEHWLADGPLPADAAARVVDQIAGALHAAHRRQIIHRDVKAANILLDEDRNAYLSDFSLAAQLSPSGGALEFVSAVDAASPEQLLGETLSPRADQYSLGVVIYQMLAGERPFPPGLTSEQLRALMLESPLPALAGSRGLPAAVDEVIRRATALQPADRFPDTVSLALALRHALNGATHEATALVPREASGDIGPNPYKGLRAFQESDAGTFFGREALVGRLTAQLAESRFLAIVGPSGSGKSSVVKAGLIPALRRGEVPGAERWFITEMTPGQSPFKELEQAISRVAVNPPAELHDSLARDEEGLGRVLRRVLPSGGLGEMPQLLLVIDQFEELFTLTADEGERSRFINSLLAALAEDDTQLRVAVTLRADFYDRPLEVAGLGPLLRDRTAVVLPMSHGELEEAISRPAGLAGVRLEPRLLATIIADTAGQPGSLPLAQYALTELFERQSDRLMTIDAYQAIGGVSGALGRRADEICETLSAAEQEAARQMFLRLVTLGEGVEDTRRRVLRSELEAMDVGEANVAAVIDAFGHYRLLTFDNDPLTRGPTVEVAHEALLREWARLRGWLDESRADVRLQRLLSVETGEWLAAGQNAGYLLRGSRLDQFNDWPAASGLALTADETAFLRASQAAREQRRAEEEARRTRELETVRQLAETERKRAEEQEANAAKLSRRALLLAGALAIAGLLAVAAFSFARASDRNAAEAAERAAEANANATLAVENANIASTRQAEAAANASLAATREAEAVSEANIRATAEANSAEQRDLALASEREALEAYSLSLAANARQALEANDQPLALLLALAANTVEKPPLDSWRTLIDVAYAPGTIRAFQVGSPVNVVDVSPDRMSSLTGSDDGIIRVWDNETHQVLRMLSGPTEGVSGATFSPDGSEILAGYGNGTVLLWDVRTGDIKQELIGHTDNVRALAFLPDGRRALTGEDSRALPGELIVWDLVTGQSLKRFGGDLDETIEGVRSLAISSDGRSAIVGYWSTSASDTHGAALWDLGSGKVLRFMAEPGNSINDVAISSGGLIGYGVSDDRNVYVWDLITGEVMHTLRGHQGAATALAISPDGYTALSGTLDGELIYWDLTAEQPMRRFHDHHASIWQIEFLDNAHALTGSSDTTMRLWDLTGRWRLESWRDPEAALNSVIGAIAVSPDGSHVLTQSWQRQTYETPRLTLWDYKTGQPIRTFEQPESLVFQIAFTPDGRQAITGHQDGTLMLWDLGMGQPIRQIRTGTAQSVRALDISSDGRFALATFGFDIPTIYYFDLMAGEIIHRMNGHLVAWEIADILFMPDDQHAVSSGADGSIIIWDLATGEQIRRMTGLEGDAGSHLFSEAWFTQFIYQLALTPDGRQLLSAGEDGSLLLWEIANGRSLRRFTGHASSVVYADISPDGRQALSGAVDDDMILWDLASGKPVRRFPFRRWPDSSGNFAPFIAIHPDGQTALTDDIDGSLVKWQLAEPSPKELMDWVEGNRTLRELTCPERETYRLEPLCVDSESVQTTADLLGDVRQATAQLDLYPPITGDLMATGRPLDLTPPDRPAQLAVVGRNRGELERGDFDVWTYMGRAGEIISLHMIADQPLTDFTLPIDKRYEAGVLDTAYRVVRPDGIQMEQSLDAVAEDSTRSSDARSLALRLPLDGAYRIEARSQLDDHAGPYTLIVEQMPEFWFPEIYKDYEGHYIDGPWQWDLYLYIKDGRLWSTYPFYGDTPMEAVPLSETEFVMTETSIMRMLRDDSGEVSGYEVLYGYQHPWGGQWIKGIRIGDVPAEYLAALAEGESAPEP